MSAPYYAPGSASGPQQNYGGGYPSGPQTNVGYPPQSGLQSNAGYPSAGGPQPNAGYPYPGAPQSNASYPPPGAPQPNAGYPPPGGPQPKAGYPAQGAPQTSAGYAPQSGYPNSSGYPPGPSPGNQSGYPAQSFPQSQTPYYPQRENDPMQKTSGPFINPQGPPPQGEFEGEEEDSTPSAPPLDSMQKVAGYENISFQPAALPPPTYDDSQRGLPPERQPLPSFVEMKPDEARDVLYGYVSEHCCYGKGPVRNMVIEGIKMTSAFHYTIETFCEKRETSWEFEPYDGSKILDGPQNGPAPGPWDVYVPPSTPFTNNKTKVEVPHTAFARMCHTCGGGGRTQCKSCYGRGKKQCIWCKGRGHKNSLEGSCERCTSCSGTGYSSCISCSGSGMVKCKTCKGKCQLKCFVQLTVTWINHKDDHVYETTDLPSELICGVSGEIAFEEQMPRVWPVSHFPNQSVNDASNSLVQKHATAFRLERTLEQRHSVQVVPVSVVSYSYKNTRGQFFIYGLEDKVYFPDYPASCCCGCTVL